MNMKVHDQFLQQYFVAFWFILKIIPAWLICTHVCLLFCIIELVKYLVMFSVAATHYLAHLYTCVLVVIPHN